MKAVVFSPSLLQGVLSFTASRRAFSLSRISKLGSTNGSHNIQNLHRAASDVGSFLEVVEMKPLSATKIIIGPSTEFDIGLSTKLAGAVFGIEGMNIFPSVFNPKYSWKPSEAVLNSVKSSILLSKFNTNGNDVNSFPRHFFSLLNKFPLRAGDLGEDASMPKMCNTVNISAGNLLPELLSHVCNHGDIGTRLSLQHQVIIAVRVCVHCMLKSLSCFCSPLSPHFLQAGWHVAGMWIQVQGLTNMFTYDAPTRGPLEPCLFTSEDGEIWQRLIRLFHLLYLNIFATFLLVFPLTAEEIRTLRNAEANVSAQTGPLEFSAPPTGSASVAVLEYKPTVHGSLYDR